MTPAARTFMNTGLALAAVWLLAAPLQTSAEDAAAARPNIVFILADDLGMGDLGCYGQTLLKTPNIDRLAAEGTRFTSAYAGSMVCAPSRCMLMTGRHPGHATVRENWEVYPEGQWPLKPSDTTVAEVLKQAGYATGICGKWGLGAPDSDAAPNRKGFDLFFGYNCQRHAHRYYTDYLYRNTVRQEIPQSQARRVYAQDLIAEASLAFIRENKDRPFYVFCAWTLPHGPYRTDQVPNLDAYTGTGWTDAQKVYAAMVERLDGDVGRVVSLLNELGLDQKTLVIFASDNGAGGGDANNQLFGSQAGMRDTKGTLREGGIRVPMLARWPGRVPAGRTSDFLTAFWDFLPTAAALANTTPPKETDGISIAEELLGKTQPAHKYLYWEDPRPVGVAKAVRMGRWKGFQAASAAKPLELYDLAADPQEAKDVAKDHPDIVKRIQAIMAEARTEVEIPKADPRIWKKYQEDNRLLDAKFQAPAAANP